MDSRGYTDFERRTPSWRTLRRQPRRRTRHESVSSLLRPDRDHDGDVAQCSSTSDPVVGAGPLDGGSTSPRGEAGVTDPGDGGNGGEDAAVPKLGCSDDLANVVDTAGAVISACVWGISTDASYAYPAGGNAAAINDVVVPAVPR